MGTGKYGQNAVDGTLAYDFDNPELYQDFTQAEYGAAPEQEAEAGAREREQEQARAQAQAQAKPRQSVAPGAVLGVLIAAALFVLAMMAQSQLVDLSSHSVELEQRLGELETERDKLRIAYEGAFNLTEIERYATRELGMHKPGTDQIIYIDTSFPDRAVVVRDASQDSFVDRASDFLSELGSYFR